MSGWVRALSIGILVATVPGAWTYRVLLGLPRPLVSSHRRWPAWANLALIGGVTVDATVFIHSAYYAGRVAPVALLFELLIAVVVYVFGFVLLVRQFGGLYPEYFVTTGRSGLGLRKVLYQNVGRFERVSAQSGETRLGVDLRSGERLNIDLPSHQVKTFEDLVKQSQPPL